MGCEQLKSGSITFDLCKAHTDKIVLVSEHDITEAIRWMLRTQNLVIEGAAAVGIAAFLNGTIEADDKCPTAIIVTGSNIDYDRLKQIIG